MFRSQFRMAYVDFASGSAFEVVLGIVHSIDSVVVAHVALALVGKDLCDAGSVDPAIVELRVWGEDSVVAEIKRNCAAVAVAYVCANLALCAWDEAALAAISAAFHSVLA